MEDSGVERSENEGGFGLGDMPELCTARILAFTTPKDVCRLAAVSQLFRRAANSEATWEAMLPPNYRNIISEAANPIVLPSKKELYFHLCDSILIEAGRKRIWLERSTGKICYMLSARDLTIIWGSDDRYWRWVSRGDSRFEQVAELHAVCWLEVKGRIECARLSPNTVYAVSFVLKIADRHYGLENTLVKFSVAAEHGERQISARCLVESEGEGSDDEAEEAEYPEAPVRCGEDGWKEFVAGVFTVEKGGDEPSYVEFRLDGCEGGRWKSGLILDGVKIEPRA